MSSHLLFLTGSQRLPYGSDYDYEYQYHAESDHSETVVDSMVSDEISDEISDEESPPGSVSPIYFITQHLIFNLLLALYH